MTKEVVSAREILRERYARTILRPRYRGRKAAFWHGFLSGISSVGYLYPGRFRPVPYRRSCADDLIAIGHDMWNAVDQEAHEQEAHATTS